MLQSDDAGPSATNQEASRSEHSASSSANALAATEAISSAPELPFALRQKRKASRSSADTRQFWRRNAITAQAVDSASHSAPTARPQPPFGERAAISQSSAFRTCTRMASDS